MNATGWREGSGPATDRLVLDPRASRQHFELVREAVPDDLGDRLAHTWVVTWDLRGKEPYLARVLPQPHVHVTVEHDGAWVTGVPTGRYEYVVEGRGRVVGAALRPGGLRSWSSVPAQQLTGRRLPLQEVVPLDVAAAERAVAQSDDPAAAARALLQVLRENAHGPAGEQSRLVAHVVDVVLADPGTRTVSQAATAVGVSVRTLQRLFADLVGVSPRWVLLRHRLHQVTGAIAAGQDGRWGELATEMGYADQSHFIRDFRSVVGMTPTAYARACRASGP